MPFKSQAQRRKFYAMASRGEISKSKVKEWEAHTPKGKELPESVKHAAFLDELSKIATMGYLPRMAIGAGLGGAGGAGIGAALSPEDRLRGALMGGLSGLGIGAGAGALSKALGPHLAKLQGGESTVTATTMGKGGVPGDAFRAYERSLTAPRPFNIEPAAPGAEAAQAVKAMKPPAELPPELKETVETIKGLKAGKPWSPEAGAAGASPKPPSWSPPTERPELASQEAFDKFMLSDAPLKL